MALTGRLSPRLAQDPTGRTSHTSSTPRGAPRNAPAAAGIGRQPCVLRRCGTHHQRRSVAHTEARSRGAGIPVPHHIADRILVGTLCQVVYLLRADKSPLWQPWPLPDVVTCPLRAHSAMVSPSATSAWALTPRASPPPSTRASAARVLPAAARPSRRMSGGAALTRLPHALTGHGAW